MDTLTHALLGMAIGAIRRPDHQQNPTGPARPAAPKPKPSPTDRAVFWTTIAAAELPDLDVIIMPLDPLNHIRYHRGFTHSLTFAVMAAALLSWLAGRVWPGARRAVVFWWSLAGITIGHLAADWITGFGTRFLWPFSFSRYALDWVSLYEPLLTVPLLAAAAIAFRRPAWARGALTAALIIATGVVGWRGWSHEMAAAAVRAYYGAPEARISVEPTVWRLWNYGYVVEQGDSFRIGEVRRGHSPEEWAVYPKAEGDEVIGAAEADPRIREIMRFARHALLYYDPDGENTLLSIVDFRGGYAFNFRALLDDNLRVLWAARDYSAALPNPQKFAGLRR